MQEDQFDLDQFELNQASEEEEAQAVVSSVPKDNQSKKTDKKPQSNMPKIYHSAKRCVMALVEGYFKELRQEYLRRKQLTQPKLNQLGFTFNRECLSEIKRQLTACVTIQQQFSTPQLTVQVPDIKTPIYIYVPEKNSILLYSYGLAVVTKQYNSSQLVMPGICTPVQAKGNVYLLDGCCYNTQRRVYIPTKYPIKISLQNGVASELKSGKFNRMKCAVIKHQDYIYTLGGLVTDKKIATSSCERFNWKAEKWQDIPSTSNPHICATATIFNNNIILMSHTGIQKLNTTSLTWESIRTPYGLTIPSFCYVQQISNQSIAILGGWYKSHHLQTVQLWNVAGGFCEIINDMLPLPISRQRVSGINIIQGKVVTVSPFYGQVHLQLGFKKEVFTVLVSWSNFSQLRQIISCKHNQFQVY